MHEKKWRCAFSELLGHTTFLAWSLWQTGGDKGVYAAWSEPAMDRYLTPHQSSIPDLVASKVVSVASRECTDLRHAAGDQPSHQGTDPGYTMLFTLSLLRDQSAGLQRFHPHIHTQFNLFQVPSHLPLLIIFLSFPLFLSFCFLTLCPMLFFSISPSLPRSMHSLG